MKKTRTKTEKLTLEREVLRTLQIQQLENIAGGTLPSRPTAASGGGLCCS